LLHSQQNWSWHRLQVLVVKTGIKSEKEKGEGEEENIQAIHVIAASVLLNACAALIAELSVAL
jgi:hypothetical protein